MNEPDDQAAVNAVLTDFYTESMYFPVSPVKLVVMSVCTFGFYDFFWYYSNWSYIKDREQLNIYPIWRAIFAFIFAFPLFNGIQGTAKSQNLPGALPAGPLAIGWVVLRLLGRLPDPFWLVFFLAVIFLVPVQNKVNEINRVADLDMIQTAHSLSGTKWAL